VDCVVLAQKREGLAGYYECEEEPAGSIE
jgi:hypothetical protein